MSTRQRVECPACHKFLFAAWWVAEAVSIETVCRCGRKLEVGTDYHVEVLEDLRHARGERNSHQVW